MNNKQLIYEKREAKKRKIINSLKNEITVLEDEIKMNKVQNKKNSKIKNLKITGHISKLTAPFILTTGICIGTFSYFGATPFMLDDVKQYSNIKKTFDNLGNIKYEQQYEEYNDKMNVINYYGKWEQIENGFYKREVETYDIGKISESKILELLNSPSKTLKEIFGEPILKRIETNNNVLKDELMEESFLQAMIYSEIKSDYIFVKEKASDNIMNTIGILCLTFVLQAIPLFFTIKDIYKSKEWLESLDKKYPTISIDENQRKLEIKKSNFNILTRK